MQRLLNIGFQPIGWWELGESGLQLSLELWGDVSSALYAFVVAEEIVYVGKTVCPLGDQLYGYQRGAGSQHTNVRVRSEILQVLRQGEKVQILGFRDRKQRKLGAFKINLPAALEDDIIRQLRPVWNKSRDVARAKTTAKEVASTTPQQAKAVEKAGKTTSKTTPGSSLRPSFLITVGKTYYRQGFFNVPVAYERYFAGDGASIRIDLQGRNRPTEGTVNRRVNANDTPRIMGRTVVRDWFQKNVRLGQKIKVVVHEPKHIEIMPV